MAADDPDRDEEIVPDAREPDRPADAGLLPQGLSGRSGHT